MLLEEISRAVGIPQFLIEDWADRSGLIKHGYVFDYSRSAAIEIIKRSRNNTALFDLIKYMEGKDLPSQTTVLSGPSDKELAKQNYIPSFRALFISFVENNRCEDYHNILLGKVLYLVDYEGYAFQLRPFVKYIRAKDAWFTQSKIMSSLIKLGARPSKYYLDSKLGAVRVWLISSEQLATLIRMEGVK
jgi:hypothetical protein